MANLFGSTFNPASLSQDQQALLMAALTSNHQGTNDEMTAPSRDAFDFGSGSMENPMFSNDTMPGFGQPEFNALSDQQFLDYIGRGDSFDMDAVAPEDTLEAPMDDDDDDDGDYDLHDKRKSPGSDKDDNENSAKRRESEEKTSKKPGRKPLTTEPTTKRKAQNRAAQRAFRERKERHLKDLETKVAELEKNSESTSHENGLLRAQVEKLTNELKEYRKRLSVQSIRASPQNSISSFSSAGLNGLNNTFNFDIPQFGSPSTYQPIQYNNGFNQLSITKPDRSSFDAAFAPGILQRGNSSDRSPASQAPTPAISEFIKSPNTSISADSPQSALTNSTNTSLFNNIRDNSVSQAPKESTYNIFASPSNGGYDAGSNTAASDSGASNPRVFQFNSRSSASASSSTSPSSNYNASSSCGTSPEPSGHAGTSAKDGSLDPISEKDVINTTTPSTSALDSVMITGEPTDQSMDLFSYANQVKDPFVPMSWVDYNDNSMNLFGESFNGGSYMGDFPTSFDMNGPMSWNDLTGNTMTSLTPVVQENNPMEATKVQEPTLPTIAENAKSMVPCQKIWDKIQERQEFKDGFKDGSIDIDSLCTELRQKAKCSETGVVIDQKDIDAALNRRTANTP